MPLAYALISATCIIFFFHAQYKYPPTTVTIFGYDSTGKPGVYHTGFAQELPSPRRLGYMLLALLALFTASSTSEYVDLGSGLGCNTSAEVALASTRLYLYTQLPEVAGRLEPCSTREPRHIRYGSTLCHGCKVHPSPGPDARPGCDAAVGRVGPWSNCRVL